jgi:hypothetical protein
VRLSLFRDEALVAQKRAHLFCRHNVSWRLSRRRLLLPAAGARDVAVRARRGRGREEAAEPHHGQPRPLALRLPTDRHDSYFVVV